MISDRIVELCRPAGKRPGVYWDGRGMRLVAAVNREDVDRVPVDRCVIPDEVPRWTTLQLAVTDRCNMDCTYCQMRTNRVAPIEADMTPDIAVRALVRFCEGHAPGESAGTATVILTGGEVTLVPDLMAVVLGWLEDHYQAGPRPRVIVNTNAMGITEPVLDLLVHHAPHVYTIVSVDGPGEVHDRNRPAGRAGTFDLVASGIDRLRARNLPFGITGVVADNEHDLPATARLLLERFQPNSLGFNLVHRRPGAADADRVDPARFVRGVLEADLLARRYGVTVEQAGRIWRPLLSGTPRIRDCQAGFSTVAVLPEGVYVPCYTLPRLVQDRYPRVSEGLDYEHELLAEWRHRTSLTVPACGDCPFQLICGAGCPLDAMVVAGSLLSVDHRVCTMIAAAMNWIGARVSAAAPVVTPGMALEVPRDVLVALAGGEVPGDNMLWRSVNH